MAAKKHHPEQALKFQLHLHQGAISLPKTDAEMLVLLKSWGEKSSIIALEEVLQRAVKKGIPLFGQVAPGDQAGRSRAEFYFDCIRSGLARVSPHMHYSPLLTVLIDTAREMGLEGLHALGKPSAFWMPLTDEQAKSPRTHAMVYDELMSRVLTQEVTPSVLLNSRRWRDQAGMDFQSAVDYCAACFEKSPRLYLLRLNLGDWGAHLSGRSLSPPTVSVQDLKGRYSRFAKALTRLAPDAIVGYMARLDYGLEKGLFYHVVVLLRGEEADHAVDWAHRVGELWIRLSPEGQGAYTRCNWLFDDPASKVGVVDGRRPADRVAIEQWILPYLTLTSRYMKVAQGPRQRVFMRGAMPKEMST